MKKLSILLAVTALVFSSLACQAIAGGGDTEGVEEPQMPEAQSGGEVEVPTIPPVSSDDGGITVGGKSEFPLPDGATNITDMGGTTNFQAKMSLDEAMKFYMDKFTSSGYTERSILTVTSDTTFSMVFDGHESGKAIVVQGVDLGDGSVNVNIRLEDT